eukprot:TRINITY_DN14345_c1_g1_i1.p6 TRINITY_DN14345_c1_g1~~TRINITY_DN14345_c1_g1_i1.p6  ORF type:complete len:136 (+),score=9.69 TRINITY_DN14345_c1_g1_i1:515-922(+)
MFLCNFHGQETILGKPSIQSFYFVFVCLFVRVNNGLQAVKVNLGDNNNNKFQFFIYFAIAGKFSAILLYLYQVAKNCHKKLQKYKNVTISYIEEQGVHNIFFGKILKTKFISQNNCNYNATIHKKRRDYNAPVEK